MQFQGMDIPPSPDQDLAYTQDHSSTVVPVTPAASKLTIPASRFAVLPPIETENVADAHKDALVSSERDELRQAQHIPMRTFGQPTAAETIPTPREKGVEKTVVPQSERMYRTRARFVEDVTIGSAEGKDANTLLRNRHGESVDNQGTMVKERMLNLEL